MQDRFRWGTAALAAAALLCGAGCSILAPRTQQLSIHASEDDARIYVNGNLSGSGHVTVVVPRDKTVSVLVKKDGFQTAERNVLLTLSNTGMADLVCGYVCLFPLAGLLFPGSQHLQNDNISITLQALSSPGGK